jgi:hypothetical protein
MRLAPLFLLISALPVAHADPQPAATYDLGVRVGGYGFKREGDDRAGTGWTECRMNGVGAFASRTLRGPLFIEAGLDMYTSADFPTPQPAMDLPIDRMSGLLSVAGGARTQVTSWLRGYVQLGGGVELTRVAVPYGEDKVMRDTQVMPEGFVGAGVELKLGRGTYLGASFRTLVMGNFNYNPADLAEGDWGVGTPDERDVFDASLDFAAQGQFHLRRDL